MPSFLLALILFLYFSKDPFFVQGSRGDTILQDRAPDDFGSSSSDSDTWLLQPKGDSSPLLGPNIDQNENLGPDTDTPAAANSNFPSYNDENKLLLSETTTNSETGSGGGLLLGSSSSNNECRSSSSSTDDSTLESGRQTAATQQNPTKKRNIRGRWRRRGQEEDASKTFCTAAPPPPLSPSRQQTPNALENPSPQRKKKKKKTTAAPQGPEQQQGDEEAVPPTTPSIADLNWDKEMYPSLFRIPTDGYSEAGYNPTCIIKTNGLLPLGVCDSGNDEDRQNSMYDTNGNPVDIGLFLDAVTHKLNHCRLGMCWEFFFFFFFQFENFSLVFSVPFPFISNSNPPLTYLYFFPYFLPPRY